MTRFLIWSLIAIASLCGLLVSAVGYVLLTTPRPTNIRDCFTTSMFQVNLCPRAPGYVRLRDISSHIRSAVIVSEDGSFYSHQGIDWFEMRESFEKNWQKGEFARGGSTITQQLAKNLYLTPEKSLLRKVREALITVQIEGLLSKDEILEKYFNVVEFGPHLFGIGKAANFYFQKSPSQLSIAEGAFLAFLLPNPEKYSISFQRKKLTKFAHSRMAQIIGRMRSFGKINDAEYQSALVELALFFGPSNDGTTAPPDLLEADPDDPGLDDAPKPDNP